MSPRTNERLTVSSARADHKAPFQPLAHPDQPTNPTSPQPFTSTDTLEDWLSNPIPSFSLWLDLQQYEESSKKVYRSMWGKFVRWMSEGGHQLCFCSSRHISTFLDEHGLRKQHRQRYVRLIEKIFTHLDLLGLRMDNPGQEAGRSRVGSGNNSPMRCLGFKEREILFSGLRGIWSQENEKDKSWQLVRDAAIIGVITGGGAKLSEVAEMTVNRSLDDEWLIVSEGSPDEHRAPLLPIGREALAAWGRVRAHLGFGGRILFPADLTRRRHDLHRVFPTLHPAQIYRRINRLFETFGIDRTRLANSGAVSTTTAPMSKRNGAQTLRNTYAAMLIEDGYDDSVIGSALGLFADISVPRLKAGHAMWLAQEA